MNAVIFPSFGSSLRKLRSREKFCFRDISVRVLSLKRREM